MKKLECLEQTAPNVWEIYDKLQEIVYVVDIDSYELAYMNRFARKVYGVESMEEVQGKKCFEVLMGSSMPCTICNNKKLCPGFFAEEIRYNPIIKKKLALKDTIIEENGKKYRFELAVDLSACEQQNRGYEANEVMVNEGLRISLAAPTPEESLVALMEYLGQSLNSERVYIFEENEKGTLDNTYEWCANGVVPQKENLQDVSFQVVKLWYEKFLKGENVIIKNLESIRESDRAVYEYLEPQNIQSLVVYPLVSEKKIIGFYGVDNPPEKFLENIMTLLQILGHFIVALLQRRNYVRRLEELCFQDQLTGIGNRHAMNDYIDRLKEEKAVGILYCDVMGLKKVNDTKGHLEGDELLIRASQCLKTAFGDYALFRVGGDEFLVLCEGIEEKELMERVEALKGQMQERHSYMALGCVWHMDGRKDMDLLLKEADDRMYEEKRSWYAKKQS